MVRHGVQSRYSLLHMSLRLEAPVLYHVHQETELLYIRHAMSKLHVEFGKVKDRSHFYHIHFGHVGHS